MEHTILSMVKTEEDSDKVLLLNSDLRTFKIKHKIIKTAHDRSKYEWFYMVSKDEKKEICTLYILHRKELHEIRDGLANEVDGTIPSLINPL